MNIENIEMFKLALKKGINLFTGAGFSILPDLDGNTLPKADKLCEEICEKFSITATYQNDLERLSNVINLRCYKEFQEYLREKFTVTSYNKKYDLLNNINLHSYITTNIDNIIQCVMDNSKRYSLLYTKEYGAKRNSSSLTFIPLHGNVAYIDSKLYFGKSELANVDSDNKDLFDLMHGKLLEAPTLFWGYGFHDNAIERTISKLMQDGQHEIWVQCMPNSEHIGYFHDLGCYVIEATTAELFDWLEVNLPNYEEEILDQKNYNSLNSYFIPTVNQIEVVQREDYFTKGYTHWYCILLNYAYQTKNVNFLYENVLKHKNVIAVGIPFSGKTTLLMQIAKKAQLEHKLIISNISVEEAKRIINLLDGICALILIDNCCDDVSVIKLFMKQANCYVLGFTDDYAYESSKHLLDNISITKKEIGELSLEEAQGIFNHLPEGCKKYDHLIYKDVENEKFSMWEFASQNIKNLLNSNRVNEMLLRVKEKSREIFELIALSTYLTCNKSCINMDVLFTFKNTSDYIRIQELIKSAQGYLNEIDVPLSQDIENQDYYELRSNLFARLAYEVLKKKFKKEFGEVISKFIVNISPYKIYQYHIFRRSGFDGKLFSDLFDDNAYDIYDCIFRFDNSAYTLQQRALYKAYQSDFKGAFEDIDKAISQNPFNFSIKNSHAIILFEANKENNTPIAQESIAKAMETLRKCFSSDKRKVYHAQKFAEFAIYLSANWKDYSYLNEAKEWLQQLIDTQESTSSNTKNLLKKIESKLLLEKK